MAHTSHASVCARSLMQLLCPKMQTLVESRHMATPTELSAAAKEVALLSQLIRGACACKLHVMCCLLSLSGLRTHSTLSERKLSMQVRTERS